MRNYVESEERIFIGEFAETDVNRSNTKRPGVFFPFSRGQRDFEMLTRRRAATCRLALEPQSHERGRSCQGTSPPVNRPSVAEPGS